MDKESVIVGAVYKNIGMFIPFLDTVGSPDLSSSTADLVSRKLQITCLVALWQPYFSIIACTLCICLHF